MEVNFKGTPEEFEDMVRVAERAEALGFKQKRATTIMDLSAVNNSTRKGNAFAFGSLDLKRLLAFPDYDFLHDVVGISRHINRKTGELEDCFSPRCSKVYS